MEEIFSQGKIKKKTEMNAEKQT